MSAPPLPPAFSVSTAFRCASVVKSSFAAVRLTASAKVSVMLPDASVTVAPSAGSNVGCAGPVVSAGVPAPVAHGLLPSGPTARTRTS